MRAASAGIMGNNALFSRVCSPDRGRYFSIFYLLRCIILWGADQQKTLVFRPFRRKIAPKRPKGRYQKNVRVRDPLAGDCVAHQTVLNNFPRGTQHQSMPHIRRSSAGTCPAETRSAAAPYGLRPSAPPASHPAVQGWCSGLRVPE